jgi:hypothetical protein
MIRIFVLSLLLLGVSSAAVAQTTAPDAAPTSAVAATSASGSTPASVPTDASANKPAPAQVSSSVILHAATPQVQTADLPGLDVPAPTLAEPVPPAHPATPEQIREFLKLTHTVELAHTQMAANLKQMRTSSPDYIPASFWIDVQRAMMTISIPDLCIPIYQKYYSQEDMAAALAFYRSPAGRRIVSAEPAVVSVLNNAMIQAGVRVGEKIGIKYKDQLEKLKTQPPSGMDVIVTTN